MTMTLMKNKHDYSNCIYDKIESPDGASSINDAKAASHLLIKLHSKLRRLVPVRSPDRLTAQDYQNTIHIQPKTHVNHI